MTAPTTTDRDFWSRVLRAGGATMIPRWTLTPKPGDAVHEEPVPPPLVAELVRLAEAECVSLGSVVLAAHAVVLAALSGEDDVVAGYAAGVELPLPCHVPTRTASWRELLARAQETEAGLLAHRDEPLGQAYLDLDGAGPHFETILDPDGADDGELLDPLVLRLGLVREQGSALLRLRYRRDAIDRDHAGRIAGYHLAAFAAMTSDPGAEPRGVSLLSAEELHYQLEGLAGPQRDLPDRRVHELFEEQVRAHPAAVAAVHGAKEWTYAQLNARANHLGRALLDRGLAREDIVAVVTERNLDWMAAVLAIFKAGGAYLPLEPHFPPDRIARVLTRAGCRLVVTEHASRTTLDQALDDVAGVSTIAVDDLGDPAGSPEPDNLGVEVGPDQLAYLYFTSGSTGEPKGAMCEHAGMINHLFAKIDDLRIGPGDVVAQTAPQCFDISLWQLVSAVIVGGRTLVVAQDTILDVPRFVATLAAGRVNVAQLVPSYLEAVLTYLDSHPVPLPDLRCVSATGEALKPELARRWFGVFPGIPLVNAYGLTETSDDTNHAVMRAAPTGDRVPLGPAVNNVRVYVVDEHLNPVPLGAPGEIVFSGVCVGRGYVNDPERTAAAYTTDPHRPGERLYRAGDFGRWLPGGSLDFFGRRDQQVKISGHRIEIGEIENTLLRAPGVRNGVVVAAEAPGRGANLVAYYTSDQAIDPPAVESHLGRHLPTYMIPTHLHRRDTLPLTPNGKIDRKALAAVAGQQDQPDTAGEPPATPTETRVAGAWSTVLGIPVDHLTRRDHFFELGGTSLTAVKLVIALDRAVILKDVLAHPVLADLADHLDRAAESRAAAPARCP